jgi:hypothetical protein
MFFYMLLNYSHLQMLYKIPEEKKVCSFQNRLFFCYI